MKQKSGIQTAETEQEVAEVQVELWESVWSCCVHSPAQCPSGRDLPAWLSASKGWTLMTLTLIWLDDQRIPERGN